MRGFKVFILLAALFICNVAQAQVYILGGLGGSSNRIPTNIEPFINYLEVTGLDSHQNIPKVANWLFHARIPDDIVKIHKDIRDRGFLN